MIASGGCTEAECDIEDACVELTRTSGCTWEGQGPTNDCITDGSMTLTLTCDGTNTTMTLEWVINATDTVTFTKTNASDPLDCSACENHVLTTGDNTVCTDQFTQAVVNFQIRDACCDEFCFNSYQVEISGAATATGDAAGCGGTDCENLNGLYVVDFVAANQNVSVVNGLTCDTGQNNDWCHWQNDDMTFPCDEDPQVGFCRINLFMRIDSNCQTEVVIEVIEDIEEQSSSSSSSVSSSSASVVSSSFSQTLLVSSSSSSVSSSSVSSSQSRSADLCTDTPTAGMLWRGTFSGDCRNVNLSLDHNNVCDDTNAICQINDITVTVNTV